MNFTTPMRSIYEMYLQFVPFFRMVWMGTVVFGIAMLITALVLKKNSERKKSPWIVGGIGLLLIISSGTQLISSFL